MSIERLWRWCSGRGVVFIATFGMLVAGLLIFHAGVAYGERQMMRRMRELNGHITPPFGFFSHSFIPDGHGAVGTISAIALPTISLLTRDGEVETIVVSTSTVLRGEPGVTMHDLQVGQHITVIGQPSTHAQELDALFITISPTDSH